MIWNFPNLLRAGVRRTALAAAVMLLACVVPSARAQSKPVPAKPGTPQPLEVAIDPSNRVRVEIRDDVKATPSARLADLPYHSIVARHSQLFRLDPAFVHAVILVESNHNPHALSPKGALGLMQLMPETAARYGVIDRRDPSQNVRGGTAYLRDLVDMFKGNLELAVAAYNAGEKAVMYYGNQIPPFLETMFYVPRVLEEYQKLKGVRGVLPADVRINQTREGRLSVTIPPPHRDTKAAPQH